MASEDNRKKIYKITTYGIELLKAEYERLQELYKNSTDVLEVVK